MSSFITEMNKIDGFICNYQIPLMWLICNDIEGEMVEVGCWKGKTTNVIGNSYFNFNLHCVDHFMGSREHQEVLQGGSTKDDFFNNIRNLRVEKIKIIEDTSVNASEKFEDDSLDCVFIDAAHDYDNVCLDINSWYPKLKSGGLMIGHDYPEPSDPNGGFEELTKAVNEQVRDSHRFENFDWFIGIWGAIKSGND